MEIPAMTHRVIQWATGRLGKDCVAGIVGRSDVELAGAWVHSPEKVGRDVGELVGLGPLGVKATGDKAALLAMDADCILYTAGRTWVENPDATIDELAQILRSGKNVVNCAWASLVNPKGVSQKVHDALQEACLAGGTSFYTAGIEPGFGTLGLGLPALSAANKVRRFRGTEIMNQATWAHPDFFLYFGFGGKDASNIPLLQPGQTTFHHESTVRLFAEALGVEVEEIVEQHQLIFADERFEIGEGVIEAGTVSGMHYQVIGMVRGEPLISIGHVIKLRDQDFAELEFKGGGYRIEIEGEPDMRLDFSLNLSGKSGSAMDGLYMCCAMAAVNAIPQVCEAPPGVLTALDLKPYPSQNAALS
jgi:4-hydroxy-tetrahydrodipicolinate reductase